MNYFGAEFDKKSNHYQYRVAIRSHSYLLQRKVFISWFKFAKKNNNIKKSTKFGIKRLNQKKQRDVFLKWRRRRIQTLHFRKLVNFNIEKQECKAKSSIFNMLKKYSKTQKSFKKIAKIYDSRKRKISLHSAIQHFKNN